MNVEQRDKFKDAALDNFNRFKRKLRKLPVCTAALLSVILLFSLASLVLPIYSEFVLLPSALASSEFHRLTTYPLIHRTPIHCIVTVAPLVPLLERFERRWGTIRTLAMFLGPFESFPGALYVILSLFVLRTDRPISGAFGWVLTLATIESRLSQNSQIVVMGKPLPTWSVPFILLLIGYVILPGTSIIGHSLGILTGFIFATGKVNFLLLPLNVLNFVESRLKAVFDLLPNYISAATATESAADPLFMTLPMTEPVANGQPGPAYR